MRVVLFLSVFVVLALCQQDPIDNLCKSLPLKDTGGKVIPNVDMVNAFGQQITAMSEVYSEAGVFAVPRYQGSEQVSTVYYSLCRNLPADKCGGSSTCCEITKGGASTSCGTSSQSFVLDNFLQYTRFNVSLIAGITVRSDPSLITVPGNYGGASGDPKVQHRLQFDVDVSCDPLVHYFVIPYVDVRVDTTQKDTLIMRARVESQYGCVASGFKFLHLTSWMVLFYLLAPLAMLSGLLLVLLGWRLFRITSLILGLFFGLSVAGVIILFSVFVACEASKPAIVQDFWSWSHECTFHYLTANSYVGWIASVSGLLFGLALAVGAYRKPAFGGILIGMAVGAWVADYLYVTTFSVLKQHWIVLLLSTIFIPLFAALAACLPNAWKRSFFIIIISTTGGYLFCWGIGAYTRYFPSTILLDELGPRWQYYVFSAAIVLLSVIGSVVQFTITGQFDWETLVESGLCPGKGTRRRGKRGDESLLAPENEVEMDPQVRKTIQEITDVGEKE